MPEATTRKTDPIADVPELARQFHDQLLSTVTLGQKKTLEVAEVFARVASAVPTPEIPEVPSAATTTSYLFDLTLDLVNAQKQFALDLVRTLVPGKAA